MNFSTQLQNAWQKTDSLLCVGMDPDQQKLPACVFEHEQPMFEFCRRIVDQTAEFCCSYKLQFAYFAATRAEAELEQCIAYIHNNYPNHLIILDAKRGDIGDTAKLYAREAFERYGADAVTVNPYMGGDTLEPFLAFQNKGVIVLCRTSNPGSAQFQSLSFDGEPLAHKVARAAIGWNTHNNVMLVVGATYPTELKQIRAMVGDMPLLVPGVGAQGGSLNDVLKNGLDDKKTGLLINSSRGIIYASGEDDFASAAGIAAKALNDEINLIRAQISIQA